MSGLLSVSEATALAEHEQVIERGIQTFTEVGNALLKIRDGRLHRAAFGTFEEYCRVRWDLKRQRAYELMNAAAVVSEFSDTDLPAPAKESHAAALAAVPEPKRAEVWRETVERTNGKPTAAAIRETYRPKPEPTPAPPTPEPGIWHSGPAPLPVGQHEADAALAHIDRVQPPTNPNPNPIVAAVREARTAPSHIAGKAIDELKLVRDIVQRAGGLDAVLADLDDDPLDDSIAELWLTQIEPTAELLEQWRTALRRRHLRRVK